MCAGCSWTYDHMHANTSMDSYWTRDADGAFFYNDFSLRPVKDKFSWQCSTSIDQVFKYCWDDNIQTRCAKDYYLYKKCKSNDLQKLLFLSLNNYTIVLKINNVPGKIRIAFDISQLIKKKRYY